MDSIYRLIKTKQELDFDIHSYTDSILNLDKLINKLEQESNKDDISK